MTSAAAEALATPVWYEPLRSPSWLVRPVRDDAPTIVFCAEAWNERAVDAAGRDLRLGVPLYLAEAARFGTSARPVALRHPVDPGEVPTGSPAGASITIRSAVSPGGVGGVRLRVMEPHGAMLGEIARSASNESTLGAALEGLPHAVAEAAAPSGVRPIWNSLYTLPSGARLPAYVRGLHACVRVIDGTMPATADPDLVVERQADVRSVLSTLGTLATSTSEPFPALLFFGALLAARDARSSVVGEFRLQANARCTAATDPLDPVYAMTALIARLFGDRDTSDRRIAQLAAREHPGDASMRPWLARVEAVP